MSFMNRIDKIKLAIEKGITCNPETGEVFGVKGNKIGSKDKYGYFIITILDEKKEYKIKSHHFIFYSVYGFVSKEIDHINRLRGDNRIANLRPSDRKLNCHNTNHLGYHFSKTKNRYVAKIYVDGKSKYIGQYKTSEEARKAYLSVKLHLHRGYNL